MVMFSTQLGILTWENTIFRIKSHDGHIFMQCLILVANFQELLPLPIWKALNELSLFFKILTSPKLKMAKMMKLEEEKLVILCKIRFPTPRFSTVWSTCLSTYLTRQEQLDQSNIGGSVQYRFPSHLLLWLKINSFEYVNVQVSMTFEGH